MIRAIQYKNFKALRDTRLPLGRFTLLVGPNNSGKSSAMQGLYMARNPPPNLFDFVSAELRATDVTMSIAIEWYRNDATSNGETSAEFINESESLLTLKCEARRTGNVILTRGIDTQELEGVDVLERQHIMQKLGSFKIFSFDSTQMGLPVTLNPGVELTSSGSGLAGVLENLRDSDPEGFEHLNKELARWLPEFDRILFDTPASGQKAFLLRTRKGKSRIKATDLSQGTLYSLAFLTLCYLRNRPAIVCFEEPDRGIHPRLLHEIRDAMYRMAYPEHYNDDREPIQVIATTHSPYLLDLFKDHPEEIVLANKDSGGVHFQVLSANPDFDQIVEGAPLGEIWYSGILGGIPAEP